MAPQPRTAGKAAANPIDITLFGKNNFKKAVSLMSAVIRPSSLSTADGLVTSGTIAIGDKLILANLPANCVITNAFILVRHAPKNTTAQLTIKSGTDEIIAATATGSTSGAIVGTFSNKVYTKTGSQIIAEVSGAELTDGELEVVVEYFEISRAVGEYTR